MDGDRFSRGFNEVVVADLSKLNSVQVISPSTVRRYQRARVSMAMMGRLLGLEVLIEGTVQKLDERLRITARLVDVHTGRLIWAETYDERADDPGGAQEAVGRAVAAAVGKRLSVPAKR
jgi:TolB-like protein